MKQRQRPSSSSIHENATRRVDSDRSTINSGEASKSVTAKEGMAYNKLEKRRTLVNYESLPDYMKDNEFIRDHYRCEWPLNDVALSIFSVHNETLNIWTHLVGFLIFAWFAAMSLTEKATVENLVGNFFRRTSAAPLMNITAEKINGSDSFFQGSYVGYIPKTSILHLSGVSDVIPKWPWFVFLGGAMCCLICSTVSHLFACHSKRFYLFFWRLDYAGISVMIVCSFFAPIYYTFSCHSYVRLFYLTCITFAGIVSIVALLSPTLSSARYRSFRATLFLAMGFSGVIPAAHSVILYWDTSSHISLALGYELLMGILYAVGAGFYMSRIPERWKPGTFDIVGHSHQIFHVFVVAAALAHSAATLLIMDWRRGSPMC